MVASLSTSGTLADALQIDASQAAALRGFGAAAAQYATDALNTSLGQPVQIGGASVRRVAAGEFESENWDLFHPVDVLWETGGAVYSALLLLPRAELQNVLPSARGSADLPDMEALSALLYQLAEHLAGELMMMVPIQFSLADTGAGQAAGAGQSQVRLEHIVRAGPPGDETDLTVIHLVPEDALRFIASRAPVPAGFDAEDISDPGTAVSGQVSPSDSLDAADGQASSSASQALVTPVAAGAEAAQSVATPVGAPPTGSPTASPTAPVYSSARSQARTMEESLPMATGPTATQPAGTSVHPVQFQPFDGESEALSGTNLELLLDVSLRVAVELGRTDLTIKDVLALGPGSVVELDKLAGEPVDILVNDRLIAKGEVVVVDENFGVRVTDIVSPQKRLGKLR